MVYREVKVNVMNEMYSVVAQSMTNWPFSSFLAPCYRCPLGARGSPSKRHWYSLQAQDLSCVAVQTVTLPESGWEKGSEGEREVLQVCLLRGTWLGKEWEKSLALLYLLNTSIPGEINKLWSHYHEFPFIPGDEVDDDMGLENRT